MDSRLLWGALEMLILDVLAAGPSYGYAISQTVLRRSDGYFDLKEGSLYPALHRLERQKLLETSWVDTAEGRRRKYYKLTPAGHNAHRQRRGEWNRFAAAVQSVLTGEEPARALA